MRKLKDSRKALYFSPLVVIIAFLTFSSVYIIMANKANKLSGSREIGSYQLSMFHVYEDAEELHFYIEQSALYAAEQAVYELGENAGFYESDGCGNINGYKLWNTDTRECYPDYEQEFINLFQSHFNHYLDNYPIEIPSVDYNIKVESDNFLIITGIADKSIVVDISDPGEMRTAERTRELGADSRKGPIVDCSSVDPPWLPKETEHASEYLGITASLVDVYEGKVDGIPFNADPEETLRSLTEKYAHQYNLDPALLATVEAEESGMNLVSECALEHGRSALTGCHWYETCSENCGCEDDAVKSDGAQIECAAQFFRTGYDEALRESDNLYSRECHQFSENQLDLWKCLFCLYLQGPTGGDTECSGFSDKLLSFYCDWKDYTPVGEIPEDPEGCVKGALRFENVRVTWYDLPHESQFPTWQRFYEEVKMQGTGKGDNDRYYRYHSIRTSKDVSPSYTRSEVGCIVGGGVCGCWPEAHHTIAVNLYYIKRCEVVYVDLGESQWSGFYVAEDTGGAFEGGWKGIDIFAGEELPGRTPSPPIPGRGDIYYASCDTT